MPTLILSVLGTTIIVFLFIYIYASYVQTKKKADKIQYMKRSGEIRERMVTKLYETWESREDSGMYYTILRDTIFNDMKMKDKQREDFNINCRAAHEGLISETMIIVNDKDKLVELTDMGILYYEKVLKVCNKKEK
ncbi:MAG: hypothetical protein ACTSW1_07815 [Candidatus Hodarchaeales archaeon]